MSRPIANTINCPSQSSSNSFFSLLTLLLILASLLIPVSGYAGAARSSLQNKISLERVVAPSGGYGYRLQYYVPAPIDVFWRFKTDFDNDVLLTNEELIEHRIVESFDNSVITENRYATAPGLRFL